MSIPDGTYTFESVQFPGVYLRMDGSGVGAHIGSGGGTVNCQFGARSYEKFKLECISENCSYSIESVQFPGVYLRMDGSGVTAFSGPGGGTVNSQFGAQSYEKFKLIYNGDDYSFGVQSVKFPGESTFAWMAVE